MPSPIISRTLGHSNASASPVTIPIANVAAGRVAYIIAFTPASVMSALAASPPSGWTVVHKATPWGDHDVGTLKKTLDGSETAVQIYSGSCNLAYIQYTLLAGTTVEDSTVGTNANNVAISLPTLDPSFSNMTLERVTGQWSGGGSAPTQPPTKNTEDNLTYVTNLLNGSVTLGITGVYSASGRTDSSLAANTYNYSTSQYRWGFTVAFSEATLIDITITADNKSKVYGEADPTFTAQVTSGTPNVGDDITGSPTSTGEVVGTHAITQGTTSIENASSYNITWVDGTLTVTKRPITVTAQDKAKLEGQSDPAFDVEITSAYAPPLAFDDAEVGALTRDAGETPGSYDITQGTWNVETDPHAGDDDNYEITFVEGTLTIVSPVPTSGQVWPRSA